MAKQLPALIRSLPTKKPHHNKDKRNYFTVDNLTYEGQHVLYDVIFSVRKSGKGRLELLVETAYIDDPNYDAAKLSGRRVGFLDHPEQHLAEHQSYHLTREGPR